MRFSVCLVFTLLLFLTCREAVTVIEPAAPVDYGLLKTTSENGNVQAVIEIPAGTNKKIEYNKATGQFEVDKLNGVDRFIQYLPYPGNYGYIPGTSVDTLSGGDGDALDVIIICESMPTGSVIEIDPIAMLGLTDDKEVDNKIIAIPSDSTLITLPVQNYKDLNFNYSKAKAIIQFWFESYDTSATIQNIRWYDTPSTLREIRKWSKK